jgi:Lrp/AsnC family leucine-responsive transcriptional regulator
MNPMDATDRSILRILQRDGRMTMTALAEELGLSATPTLQRVRKLEEAGVIKGYAALVDRAAVGQETMVWVQVTLREHDLKRHKSFIKAVVAFPEVVEVHHVAGVEADFVLKVVVRGMVEYENWLLHKLIQVPGFDRVHSTFVLSTSKSEIAIPIAPDGDAPEGK